MARPTRWRTVPLDDLIPDLDRYSFSHPTVAKESDLLASVASNGVLRPLLAVPDGGRWRVVAGRRRLGCLRRLGLEEAPVAEVDDMDRESLWDLLLADHCVGGALNCVEVGTYIEKRMKGTGEKIEDLASRVFPSLGLTPRPAAADDPLWVAGLPERHRVLFAAGTVPLRAARILSPAPRDDALSVLDLVAGVRLGANKFGEMARWVLECAWREGRPARAWLEQHGLLPWDGSTDDLRDRVRRLRYPELSAWEDGFRRDTRALDLPPGTRLAHPRGFEGGRLDLVLSFETLEALGRDLEQLRSLLDNGRFDPLKRYLA